MLNRSFDLAITAICVALLAYTGWSYRYGPRGLPASSALLGQISKLETDLAAVTAERERRDARVALLRPETLDPDMLDEIGRRTLDFTSTGELVIKR